MVPAAELRAITSGITLAPGGSDTLTGLYMEKKRSGVRIQSALDHEHAWLLPGGGGHAVGIPAKPITDSCAKPITLGVPKQRVATLEAL